MSPSYSVKFHWLFLRLDQEFSILNSVLRFIKVIQEFVDAVYLEFVLHWYPTDLQIQSQIPDVSVPLHAIFWWTNWLSGSRFLHYNYESAYFLK